MKKKAIIALIIVASFVIIALTGAFLYNCWSAGEYKNISWKYKKGVLTISGEGETNEITSLIWSKYAEKTEEIIIEEGITSIIDDAFKQFTSVKKVTIPNSVKTIKERAFESCSLLETLDLGEGVVTIERGAFMWCTSLENVTIPDSTEVLKESAFGNCEKLKNFYIGAGVKEVGFSLFDGSENEVNVTLSEKNPYLTCENCVIFNKDKSILIYYPDFLKDETYSIPEGVVTIKKFSFGNYEYLKEIITPSTLKKIEESAFYQCEALEKIYIGESVSEIGTISICQSGKLKEISVSEENNSFSSLEGVLFNKDKTKLIIYPNAKKSSLYEVPKSVLEIERMAFSNAEILKIILPKTITKISENAFRFSTVKEISIPKSVSVMENGILQWCDNLEKIYYEGTKAEWKALSEDSYYDSKTKNHTVVCKDGEISVDTDTNHYLME